MEVANVDQAKVWSVRNLFRWRLVGTPQDLEEMISGVCGRIEANYRAYCRAVVSDILRIVYSILNAMSQDHTFNLVRFGTSACVIQTPKHSLEKDLLTFS